MSANQGIAEDPDDLDPAIVERDSAPRPRHRETTAQYERRLEVLKLEYQGPDRPLMTDEQCDDLVRRISESVTVAVMAQVKRETRDEVRQHMAEVMRGLASLTGKVLD